MDENQSHYQLSDSVLKVDLTEAELNQEIEKINDKNTSSYTLRGKKLSVDTLKWLCQALAEAPHLKKLDLGDNHIAGNSAIVHLANMLSAHSGLEEVYLDNNPLENSGALLILANIVSSNQTIQVLDLSYCQINDKNGDSLKILSRSQSLERLLLNGNRLGNNAAKGLSEAFEMGHFKYVDLNDNEIGDEGVRAIALALESSTCQIVEIELKGNLIQDAGATELGESLRLNQTVEKLSLDHNEIGDEGAIALAECLREENKILKHLSLRDNLIIFSGIKSISEALAVNDNIEFLDFANNPKDLSLLEVKENLKYLNQTAQEELRRIEGYLSQKRENKEKLSDLNQIFDEIYQLQSETESDQERTINRLIRKAMAIARDASSKGSEDIFYHLGETLENMGSYHYAKRAYAEVPDNSNKYALAMQALQNLELKEIEDKFVEQDEEVSEELANEEDIQLLDFTLEDRRLIQRLRETEIALLTRLSMLENNLERLRGDVSGINSHVNEMKGQLLAWQEYVSSSGKQNNQPALELGGKRGLMAGVKDAKTGQHVHVPADVGHKNRVHKGGKRAVNFSNF